MLDSSRLGMPVEGTFGPMQDEWAGRPCGYRRWRQGHGDQRLNKEAVYFKRRTKPRRAE